MKKKCYICGGNLTEFAITSAAQILKCSNCGLGETVNPTLQKGKYHRDEVYIEEEDLFKNIFQKRSNIVNNLIKPGKVLEIGCSTGILLSQLNKKNWEVTGMEVSKTAASVAKEKGIEVLEVPFENSKLDKKFDLVILNHTLEHLKDPKKVIEKISKILSKNGYVYIDLPNFDSLSAKLFKSHWSMLLLDEHAWHFTQKALQILLNQYGFKIIYVENASGIWDYADPLGGILSSLLNFKKRFFSQIATAIPSWILWKLRLGSDLMVIAKKT